MGKISKVYYEEIKPEECTVKDAGEFYYHFNLVSSHTMFHDDYEKYEIGQMNLKNKIIGDVINREIIDGRPVVNTSILAISSLKNKVIIIADVK
jgi:hypothetical protein